MKMIKDHSEFDFVQVSLEAGLESSLAALDLGEGGGRNRWVGLPVIIPMWPD